MYKKPPGRQKDSLKIGVNAEEVSDSQRQDNILFQVRLILALLSTKLMRLINLLRELQA